jgi:hypothetical protein
MKLLVVTSLKEYQKEVSAILVDARIKVFSASETKGFKDDYAENLMDNWFSSGKEHFDSLFFFSFTSEANAEKALDLIQLHNSNNPTNFPIRAFIVPVDKSSY